MHIKAMPSLIKTKCPPAYHHSCFVATHALASESHCGDNDCT